MSDAPNSPWRETALWWFIAGIITCLAALFLDITEAEAQGRVCGPWDDIRQRLDRDFKEKPTGSGGYLDERSILVVTASRGGETFTVLALGTNGIACVLAAGRGWEIGIEHLNES